MKKKILTRKVMLAVAFFIVITICAGVVLLKNEIAVFAWNNFKAEKVAIVLEKDNPTLYMKMGFYYFGGGAYDLKKSERYFLKALEIEPTIQYAHYQLGRIYFINGEFKNSIKELNTELYLHPNNQRAHYVLGLVYGYRGRAGDTENAEESFKKFVAWEPTNWAGYNDLAWIQTKLGKYEEAKNTVESAFEYLPHTIDSNPWLWTTLAIAELNLGDYTRSRDALLRARSISEKLDAQYFLSAYPGNDSKNAEAIFNQYKATLSFNLGIVYEKLGDKVKAKNEYEMYLEIIPQGPFPKEHEIYKKIKELSSK